MIERQDLILRICEFVENEARSGSMDFGFITPLYVYRTRVAGGQVIGISKLIPQKFQFH